MKLCFTNLSTVKQNCLIFFNGAYDNKIYTETDLHNKSKS